MSHVPAPALWHGMAEATDLAARGIVDVGNELGLVPLRDTQYHHIILDGCTVEVIESDVLRYWERGRVLKLGGLVEDDVAEMRGEGRRLFSIVVQVGHGGGEGLTVCILVGTVLLGGRCCGRGGLLGGLGLLLRRGTGLARRWVRRDEAGGAAFCGLPLPFKVAVSGVGLEVSDIDEVVDPAWVAIW